MGLLHYGQLKLAEALDGVYAIPAHFSKASVSRRPPLHPDRPCRGRRVGRCTSPCRRAALKA